MYYEIEIKKSNNIDDLEALKEELADKFNTITVIDKDYIASAKDESDKNWEKRKKKNLRIRVAIDYIKILKQVKNFELFQNKFRKKFGIIVMDKNEDTVDILIDFKNGTSSRWLNCQPEETRKEIDKILNEFVRLFELSYFFKAWLLDFLLHGHSCDLRDQELNVYTILMGRKTNDPMGLATEEKKMMKKFYKYELLQQSENKELTAKQKNDYKEFIKKVDAIKKPKQHGFRKFYEYIDTLNHGKIKEDWENNSKYKIIYKYLATASRNEPTLKEIATLRKRKERISKILQGIDLKIGKLCKEL